MMDLDAGMPGTLRGFNWDRVLDGAIPYRARTRFATERIEDWVSGQS